MTKKNSKMRLRNSQASSLLVGAVAMCYAGNGAVSVAIADVVPGIARFKVIVPSVAIGPDGQPASIDPNSDPLKNMFGDISDRALAAGRVSLVGQPIRACIWAGTPQFGVAAGTLSWLPLPSDALGRQFPSCEAFDVSEQGAVVGGAGSIVGLLGSGTSDWNQRGIIWRLGAGPGSSATWQRIDPPLGSPHGTWPQGLQGSTLLEAVSAEAPLRAVGFAGSSWPCNGISGARPSAFMVEFGPSSLTPLYWTEPSARLGPGNAPGAPKRRILGLSRGAEFLVGAQPTVIGCETAPFAGLPCDPMRWVRLEGPGDLSSNSIETVPIGPTLTSEIRGVSALEGGLGLAVGYVLPSIPAAPGVFVSQPHVWMIPASAIDPASPMLLPSPTLAGVAVLGGRADDIEQAKWRGARSTQRVAVGYSVERDPSTGLLVHSGTIWFWNGTGEGQGSWTAIDVNAAGFLEPGWKIDGVSDRILSLRGVNQYGDCVGTAIVGGVPRPVILKAVLSAPMPADIDGDGCVGPGDLAILLNAWCLSEPCELPAPAADLNHDWIVGAQDLAILLNSWGCASAAPESPVPSEIAQESKESVDFAALFVGLGDLEGYRAWAASAPAPLREVIDGVMWTIAEGEE